MKRIMMIVGVIGAVLYLQGCASTTTSTSKAMVENKDPNQYYIDKGIHFLCHKEKDAMDAM